MKQKKLSSGEVAVFCQQMAMVMKAGIPVEEGIEMMKEEVVQVRLQALLGEMLAALKSHEPLDRVLEQTEYFPDYIVQMVRVGLESGKLDEVMTLLAQYYEREESMKQGLRRVLTYPVILFSAMGIVVWLLSVKVLPVFEQILGSLGMQLTGLSAGLMKISVALSQYFVLGIFLLVIGMGGMWYLEKRKGIEGFLYKLLLKFPIYKKLALQKFTSAMALMVSSGMNLEYAMNIAVNLVEHEQVKDQIVEALGHMREGESFAGAISQTALLGNTTTRMITIATRTGYLDDMMQKVALSYETEAEEALEGILQKVEPLAVIILTLIIGSILLSVMLPLIHMMASIG